jgi:serine protease
MKIQMNRLSAAVVAMLLAACGGGGGGGDSDPSPSPSTYTLSGTIGVVETSAVDSDLNDPAQKSDYGTYKLNHNPAKPLLPDAAYAQTISTPVLLTGTVNQPAAGRTGNNFAAGDSDDYLKVDLTAGQVVELEFAADSSANDVDLYLFDLAGSQAGRSDGIATNYECVTISRTGTYYVNVFAAVGASIYNLRIGAPGSGSACGNATAAFGTSALLARQHQSGSPMALGTTALAAHRSQLSQAGVRLEAPTGLGPQFLRLPTSATARRAGLDVLAGGGRSSALSGVDSGSKSALSANTVGSDTAAARIEAMATTLRYAKALRASGAYAYVEPDWILQKTATSIPIGPFPPNDRYYPYQKWHYEQIKLPEAINRISALATQPTQRPVVAVIDSGVVLSHPDIAPALYSNGRSFVGGTSTASGDDQSSAADNSVFHGTHVSGTIAASTYDGGGAAGVAPMAQILPLNVFGASSGASTSDIANAILYAARLNNSSGFVPAQRADVINMSLGGNGSCSTAFQNAITAARGEGVIVVAAAGNESATTVGQPANCAGVIAVSATQANKAIAPYSNTGTAVKVAAPGGNTGQSTTGNGQPDGVFSTMASFDNAGSRIHTLGFLQGTSMASPHVAGVMALMRYVNPGITPQQIDTLLANGNLTDDLGTAGLDRSYGYGLINADKAVVAAGGASLPTLPGQVVAAPSSFDFGSFQTTATLSLAYSGSSTEKDTGAASSSTALTVTRSGTDGSTGLGQYTITVDRTKLAASSNYLTITVSLNSGRTLAVPVAVTKSTTSGRGAGFGPVYVLVVDPATGDVIGDLQATATPTSTGYRWSIAGVPKRTVALIAGTDLDNDGYLCQRGEACGGYPVLEAVIDGQGIEVTGNRSGLDFQVAPLSGISAQGTNGQGGARGWRRPTTQR